MKLIRLFDTVRHLRPVQVYSRGVLLFRRFRPLSLSRVVPDRVGPVGLEMADSIPFPDSFRNGSFRFLNLEHHFPDRIDWEFSRYGRLWTYNLNYFEFLNQEHLDRETGYRLIEEYISELDKRKTGLEPYPLSLRIINWIRFFIRCRISDERFDSALYRQADLLSRQPEYHLLANHLLENGFALLSAACYFGDKFLYAKAMRILNVQLREQILSDGGHFERSPMYHSLMLLRVLDCYNMVKSNGAFGREPEPLLAECSAKMAGWLEAVCFRNGDLPLVNDAANGIAPSPAALRAYASRLGIAPTTVRLQDSGFRKLSGEKFELLAEVGSIAPSYQPGHAHAGTFGFILYVNDRPVLVDTGTSTYEIGDTRSYERGTAAHNTVVVDDLDSSEVWASHRVGRRARVRLLRDTPSSVEAAHDGYGKQAGLHTRAFESEGGTLRIRDRIDGTGIAYLHFAPQEHVVQEGDAIVGSDYTISFRGAARIESFTTLYSPEFNRRIRRISFRIRFSGRLETMIA